ARRTRRSSKSHSPRQRARRATQSTCALLKEFERQALLPRRNTLTRRIHHWTRTRPAQVAGGKGGRKPNWLYGGMAVRACSAKTPTRVGRAPAANSIEEHRACRILY